MSSSHLSVGKKSRKIEPINQKLPGQSKRNLQPSGPSGPTRAGVIGNTVETVAIDAEMIDAFVNIDLAEITFVAGQTVASVIGQWVQAFGSVLAFVIVTQSALQFQRFQLYGADWTEFASRRIAEQVGSGEERQK